MALTACVLALVLGLAGSGIWFAQQRAARLSETQRTVGAALTQAEVLLEEGDKQIDHPERWQATARLALAAVEKAEELLAAGAVTEELAARVRHIREAVDAAVTDSRLLVQLEYIRLEQAAFSAKEGQFDTAWTARLYAELLRNYGVDPATPEAAAVRVRDSRLREALLAALEDWSFVNKDKEERQRLAKVHELALPPNSLWKLLREAVQRRDVAEVAKLTQELALQEIPPASLVLLAHTLAKREEWAAAEQLLRAGLEHKPGDFWLNHDLGRCFLEQSDRGDEAARYLTAALALRPDSPGVHRNLASALLQKGDLDGAIRHCQAALRIAPNFSASYLVLGDTLRSKGQLDEAITAYRQAIRITDRPEIHTNLGNTLRQKGQVDEAIAEYREALRISEEFPQAYRTHCNLGIALQDKGRLDEAIDEYHQSLRLKKDFALTHFNLGRALYGKGQVEEAIEAYRKALRIQKDYPEAHCNLGNALQNRGRLDEAIAEFHEAIRSKKDYPEAYNAHSNLGIVLYRKGQLDEAIAEYREALRIKKNLPEAHSGLGIALHKKGQFEEAIAEFREAIRLNKDDAEAYSNLGFALQHKGRLDEAIAEYREALRIKKNLPEAHFGLGTALGDKGRLDEAIAEYREALRTKRDFPEAYMAHYNLGTALKAKGQLDEAITEYYETIRIQKDYAEAYCNLGKILELKGQFAEALVYRRRGHELGSKRPRWSYPSAQWVRDCERLVELDGKLPAILSGQKQPADTSERLALAQLCQMPCKKRYAAAVRFYTEAFAAEPKLTSGQPSVHRYNAACAAALAGCGQGADAGKLDTQERARLRQQALDWLRADLNANRHMLEKSQGKAGPTIAKQMQLWLQDDDFAGVRGADALARLPKAESSEWEKLWQEVQAVRQRTANGR